MPRVLLITGASRGIGAATAVLAAQQGWAVAVNYTRDAQAADHVVQAIRAMGGQAQAFQADVGIESDIVRLFQSVDKEMGELGGLVNNAGVLDVPARVDTTSWERLERIMRINVLGSFTCAKQAVLRMSTVHGGAGGGIVNLSSAAAKMGAPSQYIDYAASKGAIDSFTVGLAKEVAAEGIRVNAVRPGLILTDIHASGGIPNRAHQLAHQVPMQRPETALEVAEAIVWLLSDAAAYVTGTHIDVGGGR
jgi:NAD(P)-dependent dehydrogenase (short-subunit alcohol dehydrogenase family)